MADSQKSVNSVGLVFHMLSNRSFSVCNAVRSGNNAGGDIVQLLNIKLTYFRLYCFDSLISVDFPHVKLLPSPHHSLSITDHFPFHNFSEMQLVLVIVPLLGSGGNAPFTEVVVFLGP